ncbi:unnamed protein product [Dicrocoelium dendriticum]|nr:unnamed protein product [Dicrocoelium dendriticum]
MPHRVVQVWNVIDRNAPNGSLRGRDVESDQANVLPMLRMSANSIACQDHQNCSCHRSRQSRASSADVVTCTKYQSRLQVRQHIHQENLQRLEHIYANEGKDSGAFATPPTYVIVASREQDNVPKSLLVFEHQGYSREDRWRRETVNTETTAMITGKLNKTEEMMNARKGMLCCGQMSISRCHFCMIR